MIQGRSSVRVIICIVIPLHLVVADIYVNYPVANLSTTWTNSAWPSNSFAFNDGSKVRAILLRETPALAYACGFYCNGICHTYLFAIFLIDIDYSRSLIIPQRIPHVVWSANRNNPVRVNATLQLTSTGDLILRDGDGAFVWSTGTAGKSVVGISMTEQGNLVLFDGNNSAVWQSFDHPTDSLLPGQQLKDGQKLIASVSPTNWSEGLYSFMVAGADRFLSLGSDPPEIYSYIHSSSAANGPISSPNDTGQYFTKLEFDGHLRTYDLDYIWRPDDLFFSSLSNCEYPLVCGEYGTCQNGQCSCPQAHNSSVSYFRPIKSQQPNLGCYAVTPINCSALPLHNMVEIEEARYFTFRVNISNTDVNHCKDACLASCSCKAAMFHYGSSSSLGDCYLPSHIYSLMDINEGRVHYNMSVFLKVQILQSETSSSGPSVPFILGVACGLILLLGVISWLFILMMRRRTCYGEAEEDYVNIVPGTCARFSFGDLKVATVNFSLKLGEGGFGSVFEGSLMDGTKVAVKCLDGLGNVKDSFLTEVAIIGNIHHVNLVRLIGFCAEKSHRILVYELMANGSLDKWIDKGKMKFPLDWECRRKIVLNIAKGLAYLHQDCRQKVIHMDVKPENILLDENFNAKLSDFGLSKLISKEQSKIYTRLRGTPGYLAPEWLSSSITEKVDVYSFGVVIMEIVCGRKILDPSEPEEGIYLLNLFEQKAKEGDLSELVDKYSEDMHSNGTEVVKMMQVAAWCLQADFAMRPCMSDVVKVLEGVVDFDLSDLVSSFVRPFLLAGRWPEAHSVLVPSVLSGPR